MVKLEGIIYRTFDHYVVLRGFAPIKDLAAISHKPESYQRPAISSHRYDIIRFLGENNNVAFVECKDDKGTLRKLQEKFINIMHKYGIKASVARSVEDTIKIIGKENNK